MAASPLQPATVVNAPEISATRVSSAAADATSNNNGSWAPEGCTVFAFSAMAGAEPPPGAELESISRRVKDFLLALLYLVGGPSNVLNMLVFYKQGLKDRVNLVLFSLALADFLYLSMALCLHGEQLQLQFTTKEQFGSVAAFMINNHLTVLGGFFYVSPVLSAIVATERCLCVMSPLRFHHLLRTRTMAALIVVTTVLVLTTQAIVAFRYYVGCVYDPSTGRTMRMMMDGPFYLEHRTLVNSLDAFVFGSGLPLTVITVVSVTTLVTAVKLRQIVRWRRTGAPTSVSPKELALTKLLVVNSALFIACTLPGATIRFLWLFLFSSSANSQDQMYFLSSLWLAELFSYINSAINVFVYYSMGSRYRETLWGLFGRKVKAAEKSDGGTEVRPPSS